MKSNAETLQPDPRLARGLWQLLVLGTLACGGLLAAGEPSLGIGPAGWLVALPLAALAAAYRRRLTMTFVLQGAREARASLPGLSWGVRDASNRHLVPGRRAARKQRRSPRRDNRPEPVAGRR